MKKLVVGFCAVLCAASAFAKWTYYAADDVGNPTNVACVTDGAWIFQVSTWGDTSFTTVRSANGGCLGYPADGILDLENSADDLGKSWNFNGGWDGKKWGSAFSSNAKIKNIVLPKTMTSIGTYALNSCSALTNVTVSSGYLTSIGASAFANCGVLKTFTPISAASGVCSSYGDYCFQKCTALKIPFKWTIDGNLSAAFQNVGLTDANCLEVTGQITISGYTNNSITNVVWGPNATKFTTAFGPAKTFYFPGIVPYESTFTPGDKVWTRVFGDPQMDSRWLENPTFGITWTAMTDADYTSYAKRYGVTVEEAKATVLGYYKKLTWDAALTYLVKWKSPLNDGGFPFATKVSRPEVGTVTAVPNKDKFEEGDEVSVTANPASGYAFAYWRGTLPENMDIYAASQTVTISGACDLEAVMTNKLGWVHRAAAGDEPEMVTDGNWAFKVARWNADEDYFTTVRCTLGGYICGEGTLDLRESAAQLGRKWKLEGGWNGSEHSGTFSTCVKIGEVILPKETTAIPPHLFRGCDQIKKVTVPSGYLTSIDYSAFSGCVRLKTFVPLSAPSDQCISYGELAFSDCSALTIPMKWNTGKDVTISIGTGFVLAYFSSLDFGNVLGNYSYSGYSFSSPTNTVWGPNMTTFVAFHNEKTIYFTGPVPTTTFYTKDDYGNLRSSYRIYGDPAMDAGWLGTTVAGVDFAKPTDAQRTAFAGLYGEDEAKRLMSVSTNGVIYLVKWVSPYRKAGLSLILR